MEGFIFEMKNKYYFVKSDKQKRNKADTQIILNFFLNTINKTLSLQQINNSFNLIFNKMQKVDIKRSNDFEFWFIHGKDFGATIENKDLIIIE